MLSISDRLRSNSACGKRGTEVPWCEPCARYWAPSAMNEDGTCPGCGKDVEMHTVSGRPLRNRDLVDLAGGEVEKAPWHFRLLVGLLVAYLGWRVVALFL